MNIIQTYPDFEALRKSIASGNSLTDVKLEDGFVFLTTKDGVCHRVHGNWDEPIRTKVLNHLASLDDKLFEALKQKSFIFGKMHLENIVSCEVVDDKVELFIETEAGVTSTFIENQYWILASRQLNKEWQALDGYLHYKYIKKYQDRETFLNDRKQLYKMDTYSIWDEKEAAMVLQGFTYYKGMKVDDVSILSFDIETTGLTHDSKSRVLCISNTYRKNGKLTKKLFSCDEYESDADMFVAWSYFVRDLNPSLMIGHNIFGYDLPYMQFCATRAGTTLNLGRDASELRFASKPSKFRKDGSQDYEFFKAHIYGREIVDTMFVAYHYDFSRKYESYGLKPIIKAEGLEKAGRAFYDASQIAKNWHDEAERKKIKEYCRDDSDDALALFDLMIPSYFYAAQSVPKSFQVMNYSASGSQINSFLVRSYLQDGHSIPKGDEPKPFQGAISIGNPGIYKFAWKSDISSLYPSVILQYKIYDKKKDPNRHFLRMVTYFTKQRLLHKRQAKETGDRYYKDLEQSEKIFVNSSYGLLGAPGLNFNSPYNATEVTKFGREILNESIKWATSQTPEEVSVPLEDVDREEI